MCMWLCIELEPRRVRDVKLQRDATTCNATKTTTISIERVATMIVMVVDER